MFTCLVLVLFTFYIQGVLKLKKKNSSGAKGLRKMNDQELQDFYFAPNIFRLTKGVPMGEEGNCVQYFAGNSSGNRAHVRVLTCQLY